MSWLMKWWRRRQRKIDLDILWPACKKHSPSIEVARDVFAMHVCSDPAWLKDYSAVELAVFISRLQ